MSVLIEFCQSNLSAGTSWVRDRLLEDPCFADVEMMDDGCLGNCGQCYLMPFAIVEGEIVAADSPQELLEKLKQAVEKKREEAEAWKKLGF